MKNMTNWEKWDLFSISPKPPSNSILTAITPSSQCGLDVCVWIDQNNSTWFLVTSYKWVNWSVKCSHNKEADFQIIEMKIRPTGLKWREGGCNSLFDFNCHTGWIHTIWYLVWGRELSVWWPKKLTKQVWMHKSQQISWCQNKSSYLSYALEL